MKPSPLQLAELHALSPAQAVDIQMDEYFRSKQYAVRNRRKQIMQAKQEIEQGVENDRTSITEGR
ncbi:MAG: hypothetical protein MUO31_13220 [Thermodesulfovibrionales bacterium]|nr:hypothetical protein [Thermodesulfovibrionales bacterium]